MAHYRHSVAQVEMCGSHIPEVTGLIPGSQNLTLGSWCLGFTSTVLPDSDVPQFCVCLIRETVIWERNMGKEHGKETTELMGRLE